MDPNKPYYGSQPHGQSPYYGGQGQTGQQPGYPQQPYPAGPLGQPAYYPPPNSYGPGGAGQTGPPGYPPGPGGQYYPPPGHQNNHRMPFADVPQLTREELAVLRECNRESFWRRSVPLAALNILGVTLMHKNGVLNTAHRLLHYGVAAGAGYFIGKLSYVSVCKEKIKGLRNSPLAEALSRNDKMREVQLFQDMSQLPGFNNLSEISRDDGMSYHPYENGELYRDPQFAANTSESGSADQQQAQGDQQGGALNKRPATTYDELRWKNREQYWRQYQPQPAPGQSATGPYAPGQPNNYRLPNQGGPIAPPTNDNQSANSRGQTTPSSYW